MKAKAKELGVEGRFVFTGPLDDEKKWEAYSRAYLFILPTYSENFGIVIAEALYAGVPVITTTGTPWSGLETNGCGWWIDVGVEPLAKALREATAMPVGDLRFRGQNGRALVQEKYLWPAIGRSVKSAYEEILKGRK